MAQIKVNELTGIALDWAVAKCGGYEFEDDTYILVLQEEEGRLCYSTDWSWGGPIIEREKICACPSAYPVGSPWNATDSTGYITHFGPNPLVAAMRCYVASKLGDTVEVPDELIK